MAAAIVDPNADLQKVLRSIFFIGRECTANLNGKRTNYARDIGLSAYKMPACIFLALIDLTKIHRTGKAGFTAVR